MLRARVVRACRRCDCFKSRRRLEAEILVVADDAVRYEPVSAPPSHLFVFRGRKANLIKIVYWDGTGLCLFTKRLEQGVFILPRSWH